jgi:hypothetical protein
MTTQTLEAEYRATVMREHALSLLELLFPQMLEGHKKELLSKGKEKRTRELEEIEYDGVASYLDCILLPYETNPVFLIKHGNGRVRGFELRPSEDIDAFDIHELSRGKAREQYDSHCKLVSEEVLA